MKTAFTSLLLFVTLARADMWLIVDTRTTNQVPAQASARLVDVADQLERWPEYRAAGGDVPMQIPAWFDTKDTTYSFASTYTGAVADLRAKAKHLKQSERAAIAEAREAKLAWRDAERAWKQGLRDTAKALGLPPTNGLAWTPSDAYIAALTVTNANTRRDLQLQLLQADINSTRFQLEQQFPNVQWWWQPDE